MLETVLSHLKTRMAFSSDGLPYACRDATSTGRKNHWLAEGFLNLACAGRWPLNDCGDWNREIRALFPFSALAKWTINCAWLCSFHPKLLVFAWPVCRHICSFINGYEERFGFRGSSCGPEDLWTCRLWVVSTCGLEDLWVVDRISVMYVAGGVDLWVVSDVVCS